MCDFQAAIERMGGDRKLFCTLAEMFLEDSEGLHRELLAAHRTGDDEKLKQTAHSFKGLVATFGGTAALEAARQLELAVGQGSEAVAPLVSRFEQELRGLQAALRTYLDEECSGI